MQLLSIASAQAESGLVFEEHFVLAVFAEGEAADAIEVDDGGAVDAAEDGWVQVLFELRDAAAQHVRALSYVEAGVVVGCFDPIDLGGFQERDLAGVFDDDALEFSRESFAEGDFLPGAFEGEVESCVVEGLEEIVEGSGFEGAQGVLIVCGDEDYGGRHVVAEEFEYIEAVALGHLNVEEEKVGLEGADRRGRVDTGAAFGEDFNCGIAAQEDCEIGSRERFIVDDDGG